MTTELKGVVVAFDRDIREDDAEAIINAISMIKGVLKVAPSEVDPDDFMNRARVERELREKLWQAFAK